MKGISKTKKVRLTILTLITIVGMMVVGSTNVQAATTAVLQANLTTHNAKLTQKGAEWITQIRDMEKQGGTMGLNATIDGTSLLDTSTGEKNGIDVHMMKTTEWGAVEILAASGYGAGSARAVNNVTTTNNSTGVYFDGATYEWTAGIATRADTVGNSINGRYYDNYEKGSGYGSATDTAANGGPKAGDGLGSPTLSGAGCYPGCAGWYTSGESYTSYSWLNTTGKGFVRGGHGLFSFRGTYYPTGNGASWLEGVFAGRGVAVVGAGL